jgi:hypothetical protein
MQVVAVMVFLQETDTARHKVLRFGRDCQETLRGVNDREMAIPCLESAEGGS